MSVRKKIPELNWYRSDVFLKTTLVCSNSRYSKLKRLSHECSMEPDTGTLTKRGSKFFPYVTSYSQQTL